MPTLLLPAQFFSENFDELQADTGQQLPAGWTAVNQNNDNAFWDVLPNSNNFPNNARSAPNAMHMSFDIDDPADDWLFTPLLSFRQNYRYIVRFWYRKVDTGFDTVEKLKVHLSPGIDPQDVDPIPQFIDTLIDSKNYQLAEFSFVSNDDVVRSIAFHAFSEPFQFLLAIDDVEIEETLVNSTEVPAIVPPIRVFPNPTTDFLAFHWPSEQLRAHIQLYDDTGRLIREENSARSGHQIPVDDLPPGFYTYLIRDHRGRQTSGRFTIHP